MNRRGFTLLEVIVASTIMAVAVVGLLASISTSLEGVARITEHDRAALVARRKMDELLANPNLRPGAALQGQLEASEAGGAQGGWIARTSVFERPPDAGPGTPFLMRIEMQVWWERGEKKRTFNLEAFRRDMLTRSDGVGVPVP